LLLAADSTRNPVMMTKFITSLSRVTPSQTLTPGTRNNSNLIGADMKTYL
jgi:hypothetical protein